MDKTEQIEVYETAQRMHSLIAICLVILLFIVPMFFPDSRLFAYYRFIKFPGISRALSGFLVMILAIICLCNTYGFLFSFDFASQQMRVTEVYFRFIKGRSRHYSFDDIRNVSVFLDGNAGKEVANLKTNDGKRYSVMKKQTVDAVKRVEKVIDG